MACLRIVTAYGCTVSTNEHVKKDFSTNNSAAFISWSIYIGGQLLLQTEITKGNGNVGFVQKHKNHNFIW